MPTEKLKNTLSMDEPSIGIKTSKDEHHTIEINQNLQTKATYWAGEMYLNKFLYQRASSYYYRLFLFTAIPSTVVTLLSSVSIVPLSSIESKLALYVISGVLFLVMVLNAINSVVSPGGLSQKYFGFSKEYEVIGKTIILQLSDNECTEEFLDEMKVKIIELDRTALALPWLIERRRKDRDTIIREMLKDFDGIFGVKKEKPLLNRSLFMENEIEKTSSLQQELEKRMKDLNYSVSDKAFHLYQKDRFMQDS